MDWIKRPNNLTARDSLSSGVAPGGMADSAVADFRSNARHDA